jgi:hypothetical protein
LSLGKEKNMRQACFYLSILFFCSCGHSVKDENDELLKMTNEGLGNSINSISWATKGIVFGMEEKMKDPSYSIILTRLYQKAMQITELTKNCLAYINVLESDLKKENASKSSSNTSDYMAKNDRVENLLKILQKYRKDILLVDSAIYAEFDNTLVITTKKFDFAGSNDDDFFRAFFKDKNFEGMLSALRNFENNIVIAENRTVAFCNGKASDLKILICDFPGAIVGQNSSVVNAGDDLEITAGVGIFTNRSNHEIFINRQKIKLNQGGVAEFKMKASSKPGKHYIPVKIDFTDEYGKKETIEKSVEYTVVKESPCN